MTNARQAKVLLRCSLNATISSHFYDNFYYTFYYTCVGIGPVVNVRFTPSFSAVMWDTPATAGVLSGLSYIIVIMMNNNTGQVIVSATTINTFYPLPGAPTPCQYYTANVTAFSSEYYSESVVIGQRTTGGKIMTMFVNLLSEYKRTKNRFHKTLSVSYTL